MYKYNEAVQVSGREEQNNAYKVASPSAAEFIDSARGAQTACTYLPPEERLRQSTLIEKLLYKNTSDMQAGDALAAPWGSCLSYDSS